MRIVEPPPYRSLEAFTGMRNCFELGFMHQGFLQKVVVKQMGGPLQDFTVNIFNSRRACGETGSQSSGGNDPAGYYSADPAMYQVLPTIIGTAGDAAVFYDTVGYPYRNQDGDQTNCVYLIYVEISPGTTEADGVATTWDVSLAGWTDVG